MLQFHQTYYREGLYGLNFDARISVMWARQVGKTALFNLLNAKYKLMAECLLDLIRAKVDTAGDSPADESMRLFYTEMTRCRDIPAMYASIVELAVDLECNCFVVTWKPPRGTNVIGQFRVDGSGFRNMFLAFNEIYNVLINLQLGPNESPDKAESAAG